VDVMVGVVAVVAWTAGDDGGRKESLATGGQRDRRWSMVYGGRLDSMTHRMGGCWFGNNGAPVAGRQQWHG